MVLALAAAAEASTWHITPLGAGKSDGSDWANACAGFTGVCSPDLLTRGDTYFVADGDYTSLGSLIFSSAASSSLPITIRKATAGAHGSDAGWSNAFGDGQAVFRSWTITTSNWSISGVTRNESNWRDVSAYGFRVDNSKADASQNNLGAVNIGAGYCVQNVTVEYVDVAGSGSSAKSDDGFRIVSYLEKPCRSNNITVARNAVHDGGQADSVTAREVNNLIVEYNWMARNSPVTTHTQGADIMSVDNLHWRFNVLEDIAGTAYFATPDQASGLTPSSNYFIYGNVFMRSAGSKWACSAYVIGLINTSTPHAGAFFVYNNTIVRMNSGACFGNEGLTLLVHQDAKVSGATIRAYNNVTWDSIGFNAQLPAQNKNVDWSHNAYFAMSGTMTDSDATKLVGTGSPFVDGTNNDFRLKQALSTGVSLSDPFNVDMYGTVRNPATWQRGAIELSNSAPVKAPPAAPKNFQVKP
jgi:hypothetical protein